MSLDRTPQYECSICKKKYARQEHLNRHASSHTSACPFVCSQCGKRFKRSDILRRHNRSCTGAASGALTSAWSGGTTNARKRACKTCIKQKRRCDLKRPCTYCASQDRVCEYPSQARVFRAEHSDATNSVPSITSDLTNNQSAYDTSKNGEITGNRHTRASRPESSHKDAVGSEVGRPKTASFFNGRSDVSLNICDSKSQIPQSMVLLQDPADSFSFLVTFTRNEGIVSVFESDKILRILRKASEAMLETGEQAIDRAWGRDLQLENDYSLDLVQNELTYGNGRPFSLADQLFHDDNLLHVTQSDEQIVLTATQNRRIDASLASKSAELIHAVRSQSPDPWSFEMELKCAHFFSPSKVHIFLEAYWSIWSPHWPAVHRPTFDPSATPVTLLAALVLVGACHSPNPNDREDAKYWYDSVEDLVYNHLEYISTKLRFQKRWLRKKDNQRKAVQAIQAAYAVSVYQNWNGTTIAPSRTRTERWESIVAACRAFGLSRASHDDMEFVTLSTFDWHTFIVNEEAIRTFLWVFLVDVAFTMFHGIAPRMKLNELKMSPASSEACFQAERAEQCFEHIQAWLSRTGRQQGASLSSLITAFCKLDMDDRMLDHLAYEAFVNLWCVVCSFHVMLYHLTSSSTGIDSGFVVLRVGLRNWKAVFNRRFTNNDERFFDVVVTQSRRSEEEEVNMPSQGFLVDEPGLWKRLGFWKHAPEFWLLANIQLDQLQFSGPNSQAVLNGQGCEELALVKIRSFVERYRDARFAA